MAKRQKIQVVGDRTLRMERIFNAPRDLVFQVFSQPEHLVQWWGPKGWKTEILQFSFEEGGIWHYCMRCTDPNQEQGQESWGKATFQEIIVPEKVVYLDQFSDEQGNVVEDRPKMIVTLTFEDLDGKTKLVSESTFGNAEQLRTIIDMGVAEGAGQTWDRLEEYLQQIQI
jgi:uncharacterized protein YndB with AHSA1/START domain